MLPYWLLLSVFTFGGLVGPPARPGQRYPSTMLLLGSAVIAIAIGLRFRVGVDWDAYFGMWIVAHGMSLVSALKWGDSGYMFLNWLAVQVGGSIMIVNLCCGMIFAWGLYRLAQVQPYPWLAMLAAVPYLVVVVAMGYSRQGVAIGFLMAGLAYLSTGGKPIRFIPYVALASLFHRTAVLTLPFALFGTGRREVVGTSIVLIAFVLLVQSLLSNNVDRFIDAYVGTQWNSQGAAIRLAMDFIPATLFLLARHRFGFNDVEKRIWRNFSIATYLAVVFYFIIPSSTAVDRVALYVLPLQVVILSRLPLLMRNEFGAKALIISYSAAVLFVFLNFAVNAYGWVPYRAYWPFA